MPKIGQGLAHTLRDRALRQPPHADPGVAPARWEWDLRTDTLECSEPAHRILGTTPASLVSLAVLLGLAHPDDRARVEAMLEVARTRPGSFCHEHRVVRGDGTVRVVEWRGEVVSACHERPLRATGTIRDVTARRRPAIDPGALDTSDDAVTTCSLDGVFVTWNQGAEKLYGYTAEEAVGAHLNLIVPASERSLEDDNWSRLLGDEPVRSLETRRVTKDGRTVVVAVTRSLIIDAGGEVIGVASVGRDITEHKQAQATLAAAHAEAVAALNMKSQLIANMNHELRTPLNGVIGISRLLLGTELTAEQREYAEALRISGEALMAVVGDILDFSKVEAGKVELEDRPFELRCVVEDVCSIVDLGATDTNVRLMSAIDPTLPGSVHGDETRIRQILTNLVGNAMKFTAVGEVTIAVAPAEGPGGRRDLRFEIADTGIGIAPEAQDAIFESFAQADGSTTRRYGGTGLGLTIAKQLVSLMGGAIGVSSVTGEGSTFWFTVPLRAPGAPSAPAPTLPAGRVLIVDENATSRAILERQLSQAGATATATVPERELLLATLRDAARAGAPFDVVLLELGDAATPAVRAETLVPAIRAEVALAGTRIVLITPSHEVRLASSIDGVTGLVPRPIRRERLLAELARALGTAREQGTPTTATAADARPHGRSRRVLVAEDNAINQLVAVRLLELRGFAVDVAGNGREALEMHARDPYDAIFMDCQMPELDGYDATRAIRELDGGARHTPVIAMTASTLPGDTDRCLAAGMDYFSGKPISPDALDEVIDRALGASATR